MIRKRATVSAVDFKTSEEQAKCAIDQYAKCIRDNRSGWEIWNKVSATEKMNNTASGHKLKIGFTDRLSLILYWLVVPFGLVGIAGTAMLPEQLQISLSGEAAWIELLSALCLAITGVIVCFLRPLHVWAHVSLLAFLLAEREFDTRVLPEGSYLSAALEWVDEGALHNWAVIAVLGFWLIYGLLHYTWPLLWKCIHRKSDAFKIVSVPLLLVVVSQVIELIADTQGDFVFSLSTFHIWEELLELYFAVSILVIAVMVVIGFRGQVPSG